MNNLWTNKIQVGDYYLQGNNILYKIIRNT